MNKKEITIGVHISCRNEQKYIRDCIKSLIPQKKYIKEIIFVDDDSSDGSAEIAYSLLKKNFEKFKIKRLRKNIGAISVSNVGLRYLSTDYIMFLAGNDYIKETFIKDCYNLLNNTNRKPGIITSMCFNLDGKKISTHNSPLLSFKTKFLNHIESLETTLKVGNWLTLATLYNKNTLIELNGFNKNYYGLSDLFAATQIASKYGILFIPKIYGVMRKHTGGNQSSTVKNSEKINNILHLLDHDKKMEIFKLQKINKRTKERVIFTSIISGASSSEYFIHLSPKKVFLLKIINKIKNSTFKRLIIFLILRPYDVLSFINYRYIRHFIYRFYLYLKF